MTHLHSVPVCSVTSSRGRVIFDYLCSAESAEALFTACHSLVRGTPNPSSLLPCVQQAGAKGAPQYPPPRALCATRGFFLFCGRSCTALCWTRARARGQHGPATRANVITLVPRTAPAEKIPAAPKSFHKVNSAVNAYRATIVLVLLA